MKRVLHLFGEIKFSGAEIMYASAASLFNEKGIEMLAFSTGKELGSFAPVFEEKNIKVYHYPIIRSTKISIPKFKDYINFYKFLKKEQINILHIHRMDLYLVGLCSRIAGVTTIKTMHNVFRNKIITYPHGFLLRFIGRKLFKIKFQTISKSVYENELNYYHNPSIQINNWYNPANFYPPLHLNEKESIRKELGIVANSLVLISVGECSEVKNHIDIIKAINRLNEKIPLLYLHLGIGTTETVEKELAKTLGLQDKIRFVGNTHKVRDYLIASDIYLMPSKFEGLGNACIEAMACGLPSILYNSPGLRDLINNNDNGFLIDPDFRGLASKIKEYIDNPQLLKLHGKNAANFVVSNFSMQQNVNKIINLYNGVKNNPI
jgi:glycosyltransferase involved in cell wall biosynthesis